MNKKFFTRLRAGLQGGGALLMGLMVSAISFVSCSKSGITSPIEGIPFQKEEGGSWGMLLLDQPDKPLFSEEFDSEPSPVYDGCFSVQDKDGLYRIYRAEAKPKQIGTAYAQVGAFSEGIAPVVKPGEHICLIDKSGKTIKVLDQVEGKRILSCNSFVDGRALYKDENGKFGYLNKHGRSVIPAKYELATDFAGGRAFVVDSKYKKYLDKGDDASWKNVQVSLINREGDVQANFRVSGALAWEVLEGLQTQTYLGFTSGDYLGWSNGGKHGIYDNKGNVVLEPDKNYADILQITSDGFVYQGTGGLLGYSTLKGEKVIREKYIELKSLTPERFIARREGKSECYLLDKEDNRLATYDELLAIPRVNLLLAKDGDSKILIDYDGKRVGKMEVYDLGKHNNPWTVEDRYTPAELVAEALRVTPNGFLGMTFKTSPVNAAKTLGYSTPQEVRDAGYAGNFIELRKEIAGNSCRLRTSFEENVLQGEWEKVTHNGFFFGDWKLKNLSFVSCRLKAMRFSTYDDSPSQALYEGFQKYLSKWGCKEVSSEAGVYIAKSGSIYYLLILGQKGFSFVYASESLLDGTIQQLASIVQNDMGGRPTVQMSESQLSVGSNYVKDDMSQAELDSAAAFVNFP